MFQDQIPYVYVIVRNDLSFPQKCVQASHVVIEAFKDVIYESKHPHLIILTAKNEENLKYIYNNLAKKSLHCFIWREPDLNNEITAIASPIVYGEERKLFSNFPLLKEIHYV